MKNKLLWRLCAFIAVGTVLLFWAIAWLTNHTETSMSFIDKAHQEALYSYGQEAEKIYLEDGEQALAAFLQEVKSYLQIYRHPKPIQLLIAKGQLNESQTYLILHESNGINMI